MLHINKIVTINRNYGTVVKVEKEKGYALVATKMGISKIPYIE